MKVVSFVKCILCKKDSKLTYKKPNILEATTGSFYCDDKNKGCGAKYFFRIERKPGDKTQANVKLKIISVGNVKIETIDTTAKTRTEQ